MNITLNLTRSKVQQLETPIYRMQSQSKKMELNSSTSSEIMAFYEDLSSLCSISFTYKANKSIFILERGGFVVDDVKYNISRYHPQLHKHIAGAVLGDHIIRKLHSPGTHSETNFLVPDENSADWRLMKEAEEMKAQWNREKSHDLSQPTDEPRMKRSLTPATYTIEIYLVVDYYLYLKLSEMSSMLRWPGGEDDFIAYMMGHKVNEIDVRFRSINSSSFTIGAKLVHLQIAKTEAESDWTVSIADKTRMQVGTGSLSLFNSWVTQGEPAVVADHYMLVTGLNLYGGSDSNRKLYYTGVSYVGGACLANPVSFCEYRDTSTIMTHELAHNLGAGHDGTNNICSEYNRNVMAPYTTSSTTNTLGNSWQFSECSVTYIEAFISTLNSNGQNCLASARSDSEIQTNVTEGLMGQTLSVDDQCKMASNSENAAYARGYSSAQQLCSEIWCLDTVTNREEQYGPAREYTTCGDNKWCVQDVCVYDINAPSADSDCPLGEKLYCSGIFNGRCYETDVQRDCCLTCPSLRKDDSISSCAYGNKDSACSTRNFPYECYQTEDCCESCEPHATPWLGTDCPYGDKALFCQHLDVSRCSSLGSYCCESCCAVNGPALGYSCEQPSSANTSTADYSATVSTSNLKVSSAPLTSQTATTNTATPSNTTSTNPATTTTTSATTTTAVATTTSTTTIVSTTPITTMSSIITATSRILTTLSRSSRSATVPVGLPTTLTTDKTMKNILPTSGTSHFKPPNRMFGLLLHISNLSESSFDCGDSALTLKSSGTYEEAEKIVCSGVRRHVTQITKCTLLKFSCGSLVVDAVVEIDAHNTKGEWAAPTNTKEFRQQLSSILHDPSLNVTEVPTVYDIDECLTPAWNTCSLNAKCDNNDGSYNCTCNQDYSSDISPYSDAPGRICSVPCHFQSCVPPKFCQEEPEDEPICVCKDKVICHLWIFVLSGAVFSLSIISALAVSIIVCKYKHNNKIDVINEGAGSAGLHHRWLIL